VYRFVPKDPRDLARGGRLDALQVLSLRTGQPIVFHADQADADILAPDERDLHTPGLSFETRWIALHDTKDDGTAPFDANAPAKPRGATPFKRPENGMFRPDGHFREFFFTETGDTNADTQAGSEFGGFGAIQRLIQTRPEKSAGRLTTFYRGDLAH